MRSSPRATGCAPGSASPARRSAPRPPDQRAALIEATRQGSDRLAQVEGEQAQVEAAIQELLDVIPNPPHPEAPDGGEDDAVEVDRFGAKPELPDPRDHVELGERLGLLDLDRAVKVSGSRFAFLLGDAVLLELALVRYALDILIAEGFVPAVPPVLVRREALYATGFLPTGEDQIYAVEKDDLYLVGTSEVPLAGMHSDEILDAEQLPLRYAGFSTCFRREAGTYGKDTRGILRVHQFDKVEMFSYTTPESSWDEHERLRELQVRILTGLGFHGRVVDIAVGDLGASAARKYDIEVWLPGQQAYRELTSASNCTDYQARRLQDALPDARRRDRPGAHAQRHRGRRGPDPDRAARERPAGGRLGGRAGGAGRVPRQGAPRPVTTYAGIDLGGTKIAGALVSETLEVLARVRSKTPAGGPDAVVRGIVAALEELGGEPAAIGVGAPGPVADGVVLTAPNLPGWTHPVALERVLGRRLSAPVVVANDGNVATLGEWAVGAGRGADHILGVFLGTGVGGGLVLDGRMHGGATGQAGEFGHVTVALDGPECGCGRLGCVEAYAGRASMERRVAELVAEGRTTLLPQLAARKGKSRFTSGVWAAALEEGDAVARQVLDQAVVALGAAIGGALNLLDLQRVVIGGGMTEKLGTPLVDRIAAATEPYRMTLATSVTFTPAALADDAGVLGAAALARAATMGAVVR